MKKRYMIGGFAKISTLVFIILLSVMSQTRETQPNTENDMVPINETLLPGGGTITNPYDTLSLSLSEGWNLITIPKESNWTAETLGENISGCTVLCMFNGKTQSFQTHIVHIPHDDFPILDGVGYFIYLGHDSYLNMTGLPITTVNVPIYIGWNLIGWYHDSATTAESLGQHITDCTVVSMFNGSTQTFLSHVVGSPHDNFPVTQGMGLFIFASEASMWHGEG